MKPFSEVSGTVLPMDHDNVDTDAIIPQRWLITVSREGLGKGLFGGWRYDDEGRPKPEFVMNLGAFRNARIVLSRSNYGCGSSREHAVWAHVDYGILAVIASSFGPIFYDNALKNGLLPVVLPADQVAELMAQIHESPGAACSVSLKDNAVTGPDGRCYPFALDAVRRDLLLAGADDIAITLQMKDQIKRFQECQRLTSPWLE
jgi:3-isopropylmalate/(R)-2-methylmalate dehydratase small subunit